MANKYLGREDAPFDEKIWSLIDRTMINSAKSQMVGRRLLSVKGPYGLGLKVVPLEDQGIAEGVSVSNFLPVTYIFNSFSLNTRDIAGYEKDNLPFDTSAIAKIAIWAANTEDDLIFNGTKTTAGLLNSKGVNEFKLSLWNEVGAAANDIIGAMNALDQAGFHGPYTLALSPDRYNLLYRKYPQGSHTELEHIKVMVTEGIFKAPTLKKGGVLMASGEHFASLIFGQDMQIGYVGPADEKQEFSISESLAVKVNNPKAICVLKG